MIKMIINADDFGLNQQCTKAICEAWMNRLITDTTMIANGTCFDYAINEAKSKELFNNIGIHFNLTEGIPLTEKIRGLDAFVQNGAFHGKINRKRRLSGEEKLAVYEELSAQTKRLIEAGISITHADSHHHIHTAIYITPIVIQVCKEYGIR